METSMKLYSGMISPMSKRVNVCAAELDVALTPLLLDFQKGENRSPDYLTLNPTGKVPTLTEDGFVLWESAAILWYLARQRPNTVVSSEARAEADTLRWMFFGACHLDPHYTTLVVERFVKARRGLPEDTQLTAYAERELARFVAVVEQQLGVHEFLTGKFGLADIALGCTLELSPLLKYDLAPFPRVRGWLERLQSRASWRVATAAQHGTATG